MILHVDMDAYYASVEIRDQPALRGKPVIVGGSAEGRGVVCAASYEARKFGVHSAMPAVTARKLCPNAIFLAPRMNHYAQISKQIRAIFFRYTPLVEPLSLDEAFLDVRGSEKLFGSSVDIATAIKRSIKSELNLVASVGAAPNKFLAKVASDLDKPDGFVVVAPNRVQDFLDPLSVGRLWGVGKVTNRSLDRLGIRTIAQLRQLPVATLRELFGEQGAHLHRLAHGIDNRSVVRDREAKSISHETTFSRDIGDDEALSAWVWELTDQVGRRLRDHGLFGQTVHLKLRFPNFHTITRSQRLGNPSNVTHELGEVAQRMLRDVGPDRPPVRLVGVGVSQLKATHLRQKLLFDETEHEQQSRLDDARDQILEKYGRGALVRGARLRKPE